MARKAEYGRGHQAFLEYARFIVGHPNYAGMPDVDTDDGGIQWEAPSNRSGGKFKDTHHRRRDWWRHKAVEVGIDPEGSNWISDTAKRIHPTKKKPCKNCGRELDIRYAYPSSLLLRRLQGLEYLDESFPLDRLEHLSDLVTRLVEQLGDRVFQDLESLLNTGAIRVPALKPSVADWLEWIDKEYIPAEPSTLSPGAMSNAPDRLDGFHSFNLCCRSKSDPGRTKENLQSYTTDRRVFEYWVEGDWVAADRLMGLVRSVPALKSALCVNGHAGPCSADHVGPISLGFMHRPEFQLLCKACNSAKNNRMAQRDIAHLIAVEAAGEQVASWYCRALWDLRKGSVQNDETALRLSKLMRDNRHTFMRVLEQIEAAHRYTFLTTFLGLEHAAHDIAFPGVRIENHVTRFDEIQRVPRTTKYAVEQKARRLRVAFAALRDYVKKENRNAFIITTDSIEQGIKETLAILGRCAREISQMDGKLAGVLFSAEPSEEALRQVAAEIPLLVMPPEFVQAREVLVRTMGLVAVELSGMWDDERYMRAPLDEFIA